MKLDTNASNVVSSANVGESSNFRIQASAHAFRLLSSGMYSDKIGAVLREIGCNASDAHIAGNIRDVPFEVKLPTQLDPNFYIKDFGPGLADTDVRELYSTYFMSTKQTSNDFTGAFGLGSKSPFSYTDSFSVTSVHDGVQRVYTAHLNDEGSPALTLMATNPAEEDWPHGISVGFPVSPGDFGEFQQKAASLYRFFSPMPRVLGLTQELKTARFAIDGKSFSLQGKGGGFHESAIVMGNVVYPLSWDRLNMPAVDVYQTEAAKYEQLHRHSKNFVALETVMQRLMELNLYLKLPIGTVQVTASREEIEYDPKSRKALVAALFDAARELGGMLRSSVDDESVLEWDRRKVARAFAVREINGKALEGPQLVSLWRYCGLAENRLEYYTEGFSEVPEFVGAGTKVKTHFVGAPEGRMKTAWSKPIYLGRFSNGNRASVGVTERTAILVADTPYALPRVKMATNNGQFKTVLLLSASKTNQDSLRELAKKLQEHYKGIPVIKVSELDEVEMKKYARSTGVPGVRGPTGGNRLIDVHYAFGDEAGEDPVMALQDVPETCRYYVICHKSRRRNTDDTLYSSMPYPRLSAGRKGLRELLFCLREAFDGGVDGVTNLDVEGYVEVTEQEFLRFKLDEYGFKPLLPALASMMESDESQEHFAALLESLPPKTFSASSGTAIVAALRDKTQFGQIAKEQLAGTKLLALASMEAAGTMVERTAQQKLLVSVIARWSVAFGGLVPKSLAQAASVDSRIGVDHLVRETVPALVSVMEKANYYWRAFASQTTPLEPFMVPVIKGLLLPQDAMVEVHPGVELRLVA